MIKNLTEKSQHHKWPLEANQQPIDLSSIFGFQKITNSEDLQRVIFIIQSKLILEYESHFLERTVPTSKRCDKREAAVGWLRCGGRKQLV